MLMLCLKIFFARILDVSLGTTRTILTVKGKNVMASLIGFVEISVWFLVVREALNTESTSMFIVLSYAGGFAAGTYIGSFLSDKFISGIFTLQVITSNDTLANELRNTGFAVSVIPVEGKDSKQNMLFIEIDKKHFHKIKNLIKEYDPKAFIVTNETKYVQNGYFKEQNLK